MIREAHGNLLDANVDALVNTVNTVGVMGKGIALQFRRRFPDMFAAYARAAKHGELRLGRMHVWETGAVDGPRFIINFPTKGHWRSQSRLGDIEVGLLDLVCVIKKLGVTSIAVPPLGCGNGGLEWDVVRPLIVDALGALPDIDVALFPPDGAPPAAQMLTRTPRPAMTPAKAAFVITAHRYAQVALSVSLIEVQKLMYFLQVAGEDMRLRYVKARYGPYADNLRHALSSMEGHFITGFGDGSSPVRAAEPITLFPDAVAEAASVLRARAETTERVERVVALSNGYESAYGMELLASVHWVSTVDEPGADATTAAELVSRWNARKQRMMGPEHVRIAWRHLHDEKWLPVS